MKFYTVFVPPSVGVLLGEAERPRFSRAQTLGALLDCFARLPLSNRVRLVAEYLRCGPSADHSAQAPPGP
jgi:hypothetical protein